MCRHDGLPVSAASVLRLLREDGLLLEANYQRERRQLAARRKAAFAVEPTGANQVWQLDFTEFETTSGATWRLAGCRDYWSKYELGWHVFRRRTSTTPSPRSSSPSPRPNGWPADRCASWLRTTPTGTCCR
jgi:transposase InsO family protein